MVISFAKFGRCVFGLAIVTCFIPSVASGDDAQDGTWQVYTAPQISLITVDGNPVGLTSGTVIVVRPGQKLSLSCAAFDVDRKWIDDGEGQGHWQYADDKGEVIWTGSASFNPSRTKTGAATEYTAPTTAGDYTVTAQADDEPTLADDSSGGTTSITVRVHTDCPDSIADSSSCTPLPKWTYWATYGLRYSQMCVTGGTPPHHSNPPPDSWVGLAVTEVVTPSDLHDNDGQCREGTDLNGDERGKICAGSSTWTCGQGFTAGTYPVPPPSPISDGFNTPYCPLGNSDNCFWDVFKLTSPTHVALKSNHGPCTVVCNQEYFCGKGTASQKSLGTFTITFSLQLINSDADTQVTVSHTNP